MTNRRIAIVVGVLFLVATVASMLGQFTLSSILEVPDYLVALSENEDQAVVGGLITFVDGVAILGIAVLMFPILKRHGEGIALGYAGTRIAEFAVFVVYLITPLLLVDLGQEYVQSGSPNASYFQMAGVLILAVRHRTLQMIFLFNSLAGLMFSCLLYKSKLVPRLISVLGLVAYSIMLPGTLLYLFFEFDMNVLFVVFLPGVIFEIVLPIRLLARGFAASAIASGPAGTDG